MSLEATSLGFVITEITRVYHEETCLGDAISGKKLDHVLCPQMKRDKKHHTDIIYTRFDNSNHHTIELIGRSNEYRSMIIQSGTRPINSDGGYPSKMLQKVNWDTLNNIFEPITLDQFQKEK